MQASQHRPGRPSRLTAVSLALALLLSPLGWSPIVLADWQEWDFSRIFRTAEQRYGPLHDSRGRIEAWRALLSEAASLGEREKLDEVNRFFNRNIAFSDDTHVWQQEDYWATPVEALIKGAGDCEDYALAKYFTLRRLGVSSDRMRITYVKALRLNQAHMVLTYYQHPQAMPLVLDNLIDAIEPANRRTDLVPVYAFNAEGLWLPGAGGGKQVGDSKRLSRWQDLLKKMRAEGFP
jgi:predicted transglutaminase-like cysteine proteinase